jgi:hypothetical protein
MRKYMLAVIVLFGLAGTVCAANFNLVPNALRYAKPGEWVLLQNVENPKDQVKVSIVSRECEGSEEVVVLKREEFGEDGTVADVKDRRIKMSRYQERLDKLDQRADRISREKMTIADREITVYVIEWEDTEKDREIKIWLSYDIPAGGFVRIWSSDPEFPTYELVEYGNE